MKLENLVFQKKKHRGNGAANFSYPNVRVTCNKSVGRYNQTRVSFRVCANLYESNTHCVYAIAGNRLYFMFCGKSESAYKLQISTSAKRSNSFNPTKYMLVGANKELSKFIRDTEYTPKLDNECGLWYIEY